MTSTGSELMTATGRRPHRHAVVVLLTMLMLVVSGCTDPPGEPGVKRPDATFQATVSRQADGLRISYRLRNTGSVPLIVYNGVPRTDSPEKITPAPEAVYVTARTDGTVELAKRTFPVPEGVNPYARLLVGGTIVPPGDDLSETFTVPLPLIARRPYQEAMSTPPRLPDPVRRVVFCLGATRQDAFPTRWASGAPGAGDGPVFLHPSPQHLFCSDPFDLDA